MKTMKLEKSLYQINMKSGLVLYVEKSKGQWILHVPGSSEVLLSAKTKNEILESLRKYETAA